MKNDRYRNEVNVEFRLPTWPIFPEFHFKSKPRVSRESVLPFDKKSQTDETTRKIEWRLIVPLNDSFKLYRGI
jgi:hypothetical protein